MSAVVTVLGFWLPLFGGEPPAPVLKTAAEVLALSPEAAVKQLPVTLRGVVTVSEPDWQGRFFMQDASGGVFAHNVGRAPAIGDLIEAEGVSSPGAFAPVLHVRSWKKIGTAPLPAAKEITIERLMAGVEDGQRVEITGLVRAVHLAATKKIVVEVSVGGYHVRVLPKLPPQLDPQSLVAAKVTVRGTAATSFNAARRQLTAVNLFVPTVEDFVVDRAEPGPPFEQPMVALGDIARYRPNASLGERIHVRGTVTFRREGLDFFMQDRTGGLHIESEQMPPPVVGKIVEAVGFLEFVNYQPVLSDAVFRVQSDAMVPLPAAAVPVAALHNGLHSAELIVLRGKLLDRSVRAVRREEVPFAGMRVSCTIQNAELTFTAECEQTEGASPLLQAPLGSEVEVQGIASFETGDDGKMKTLTLLLPEVGAARVVKAPSWFTAERLLVGFAVVCALLAGVAAWLLTISRKNVMLNFLVSEREKAQQELQQAHDHLEARVKERTEQLQSEMTVRKSAQLQFRAVLTERTRLARELHDTLEQALTGIALQLDTAAKLFDRSPREAGERLELARGFLRQSQLELRRSIWDLRSRELEQFDLAEAFLIGSRQITAGSEIRVEVETEGERRPLSEIVEESLLRIGQEAVTNVVKHSGATLVTLRLTFGTDAVSLEIRDNGSGFVAAQLAARGDRHFGLLGMSERAKRLGGRLDVSGPPGEGTTVRAIIPLGEATPPQPAASSHST